MKLGNDEVLCLFATNAKKDVFFSPPLSLSLVVSRRIHFLFVIAIPQTPADFSSPKSSLKSSKI